MGPAARCRSRRRLGELGAILVAEHDPLLRTRLGLLLALAHGPGRVLVAQGHADAVDRLVEGRPRLLVLDTEMGGWLDVLRCALLCYGDALPIVLTGSAPRAPAAAHRFGAAGYLRKPLGQAALSQLVGAPRSADAPS